MLEQSLNSNLSCSYRSKDRVSKSGRSLNCPKNGIIRRACFNTKLRPRSKFKLPPKDRPITRVISRERRIIKRGPWTQTRTKAASLTASGGAADDPRDEPSSGEEAPRPRGGRRPRHPLRLAAATLASPPRRLLRRCFFFLGSFLRSHGRGQKKLREAPYARRALRNRGDSRVFISRSRTTRRVTPCIPRRAALLLSLSLSSIFLALPAPPFRVVPARPRHFALFPWRSPPVFYFKRPLRIRSRDDDARILLRRASSSLRRRKDPRKYAGPPREELIYRSRSGDLESAAALLRSLFLSFSHFSRPLSPRFPPPSFDRQDLRRRLTRDSLRSLGVV